MLAVFYTNRGPRRKANQDAVLINGAIYTAMDEPLSVRSENGGVFVVADGLGGYKGGEAAAALVLDALSRLVSPALPDAAVVRALCGEASAGMRALAARDSSLSEMSSTMAGLVIRAAKMALFNCGDCRVYRLSRPYPAKLSHDHSVVQELFDQGLIDEDEMRVHPRKNIVTAAIGTETTPAEIFFQAMEFHTTYKLFLCSDGVWEALPAAGIAEILREAADTAANTLVAELFRADAADNISFIILEG